MKHWADQRVALLTQHGKERVIAPVLEPALGCVVHHVDHFDTDQLGTFTRDVPRPGSQLDAARDKARMGMTLSGLPVGLASEGSFGPDPFTGMFPWNVEMLVWLDDQLGIEVVGMAQGPAQSGHLQTAAWEVVERFAKEEDFPNPTRMARIGEAAKDLLQRLQSTCPVCEAPGYWIAKHLGGLPCGVCKQATKTHISQEWACVRCDHRHTERRTDRLFAEPQHCEFCNP